ncbi:MAG: DNA mismatch repair endonuclease MutL [Bacilli bacterium]|nr:DNA mismatch repair endonuclease MutL [Bacilli bacterium]
MSKIKIMDEILANKIAAGEVVERCASVVKELVENAIDANAASIKVDLIESGTKEIKVTDDGTGMDRDDAILAFSRHATSKLKTEKDLFNINTLGFRGEALAAISSVSIIELTTSTGEVGTIVNIKGGKIEKTSNGDARKGTIIKVSNLFYNTPARLKHLKSLYTELANITDYMNKLSLSHPNISFTLTNNNEEILKTDGLDNLLKVIKAIYGLEVTKKMLYIKGENDEYQVEGYISIPEVNRSSRNHMITLVNGRVVKNMELNRIINDSYHSFKPDNRYPITVINISCDPAIVDVNIHPTKMDIKFSKIEELCLLIGSLIKEKIRKINLIPAAEEKPTYIKPKQEFATLNFTNTQYEETININNDLIQNNKVIEEEPTEYKESKERMPIFYPVGLVHGTYIICQNELGMYIIDQHAAKERINYELFKKNLGNPKKESITLLFPITIELSNSEFIIMRRRIDILRKLNFNIEEFGINSLIIKSHPVWLPKNYEEQSIRKIIEIIIESDRDFSIEKFNESTATTLSCKLAIKANENITLKEMEQLIADLRNCDNPFNCPHGRPTTIFYANYDLEKLFKRSGFESLK